MFPIACYEARKGLSYLLVRVYIFTLLNASYIIIILDLPLLYYLDSSPSQPLFVDMLDRINPINLFKYLIDYALDVLPSLQ